jgi:hypothetical protein
MSNFRSRTVLVNDELFVFVDSKDKTISYVNGFDEKLVVHLSEDHVERLELIAQCARVALSA